MVKEKKSKEEYFFGKNVTEPKSKKARYYDTKIRLLRWEKDNYSKIAILIDTNGYSKLFDHSAIIFVCKIAKELGLSMELVGDSDFQYNTDRPMYGTKDLELLKSQLERAGAKLVAKDEFALVYEIGYHVDEAMIRDLEFENQRMKEMANKLISPNVIYPALGEEISKLFKILYENLRKTEKIFQDAVGVPILQLAIEMSEGFVEACNGRIGMNEYLSTCATNASKINARMSLVLNQKFVEDEKCYRILQQVSRVEKKIAGAVQDQENRRRMGEKSNVPTE